MTQAQLAERLGKTVEMISQIENNTSSTKLSTLSAMAEIFGIEPYQLLMAVQEKPTEFLNALLALIRQYNK